ncbi:MAG TPA: haloacid dehalogenase-like hydrolase [Candidatus Saccharimonadales bacterium]|nr:haloacid dehalogenase-like hydrolase [Candidatus Saccharimonadales bacterium]
MPIFTLKSYSDFIVANTKTAQEKLERFTKAGPANIHYLFDFDRTLTTSKNSNDDVTTWHLLHTLLPPEGRTDYNRLGDVYQTMEFSGTMTANDAERWWIETLELCIRYRITHKAIQEACKLIKLRDGAPDLFTLCEQAGVPTIILSAGVYDIIDHVMRSYKLQPTAVLSTRLQYGTNGQLNGWDRASLIHSLNKHEMGHSELSRIRNERPFTVLIGDSLEDANMVDPTHEVLRIRVDDHRADKTEDRTTYLQKSFAAGYDIVTGEDLLQVAGMTKRLLSC